MSSDQTNLRDAKWAAERLGVSAYRVYALARTGVVPAVRLGRLVRFDPTAITDFIAGGGRGLGLEGRSQINDPA